MSKIIVIKNNDGTCGITRPAPEMFDPASKTRELLASTGVTFNSDEEVLNYIISNAVPVGAEYRVTDMENLPSDRTFRNAWTDNNPTDTVDIDMNKARQIQMDVLRIARSTKLAALDVLYLKADEADNAADKSQIKALKQQLRDMPQTFDLSVYTTPEELKTAQPDYL